MHRENPIRRFSACSSQEGHPSGAARFSHKFLLTRTCESPLAITAGRQLWLAAHLLLLCVVDDDGDAAP
eukprot:5323305-Pyramimonas_sp.AAC.1